MLISVFLFLIVTIVVIFASHQEPSSLVYDAIAKEPRSLLSDTSLPNSRISSESGIFAYTMHDIDGNPLPLNQFKGQVIMIVNTASFCGNTPQYGGLQTLYERYRDQGFTILAFPANDFGKQEPGNDQEIAEFCYTKYALEFPLFSKITVIGENKHPLYQYLTEHTPFKGEIKWNFQKFLIDRSGHVVARYRPGMKPLTQKIIDDIEDALTKA
ncbi:MAG: glutathione peroxidase [Nitrospirales bacterium]|nr:glutathione peroxidase [Nitrospirales bacterium]